MTTLYRHFSKSGTLLYVGISDDHRVRFSSHMKYAEWKERIATITLEKHATRAAAAAAEIAAIETEHPLFNGTHQKPGSVGYALKRALIQIDMDEVQDSIMDFNATDCATYRVECFNLLRALSSKLRMNFTTEILPHLDPELVKNHAAQVVG